MACGYSQIPGVDFTESYAPVINNVTWRILLIVKILLKLQSRIIDVETAFYTVNWKKKSIWNRRMGWVITKKLTALSWSALCMVWFRVLDSTSRNS